MKFKAAILHKSRSDLLVDEIYIREKLKVGQVLVKLKYSSSLTPFKEKLLNGLWKI